MTRALHVLRHAKSSWKDISGSDRERELNQRGLRDAPRMGRALSKLLQPQVIVASPARRAQATLQGLTQGWPALAEQDHRCDEALYTFSMQDLLAWITDQPDTLGSLFILGHNPGLTDLVNWLCGVSLLANLPTAGYVGLELRCDSWSEITRGCGGLQHKLFPRHLQDA